MKNKYIVTADWHLRPDKPRCRLDLDWKHTQEKILSFIFKKAEEYKADIIHCGDLFDSSHVPEWVINMFSQALSSVIDVSIYLLAGNHELPHHNFKNIDNSSFGVMWNRIEDSNFIKTCDELGTAVHFGFEMKDENRDKVFIHKLTYKDKVPPFIKNGITAQELLDIYPNAKWIFTGDNHKRFIYENKGRYVINPGCIMRQTVNEIDYDPSMYLIDFEIEDIKKINIPDSEQMVTDEYIVNSKERDDRIGAFVELIKDKKGLSLSFKDVLLDKLNSLDLGSEKNIIKELMEEVYG